MFKITWKVKIEVYYARVALFISALSPPFQDHIGNSHYLFEISVHLHFVIHNFSHIPEPIVPSVPNDEQREVSS